MAKWPFTQLSKLVRLRFGLPVARRADSARNRAEWIDAVVAYHRALEWMPWREDLKVQIGNCLMEFGDYNGAIKSYFSVKGGPSLLEARKQAADANRRAGMSILPYPVTEHPFAGDRDAGLLPDTVLSTRMLPNRITIDRLDPRRRLGSLGRLNRVRSTIRGAGYASIKLDQVGSMSIEFDGVLEPLFAGVVAVRGRVLSLGRLDTVEVRLGEGSDARIVGTANLRKAPDKNGPLKLHVFNIWIDSGRLMKGRHRLEVSVGNGIPAVGLVVNIAEMDGELSTSDAFVPSPADRTIVDIAADVISRPTRSRTAARALIDSPVRSILVIRADQLGDVSASLPAIARLREMFPESRIDALVQPGVAPVVAASGIVDEVLTLALQYDPGSGVRYLSIEEEARLAPVLESHGYDLAIDLSTGDETRPLLLMTKATWLIGFNPERFTFLDFGVHVRSRDKANQLEKISHAATVMILVEALAVAMTSQRPAVARTTSDSALEIFGLVPQTFAVIHTGARHPINCWPVASFIALARRILDETDLKLVVFGEPGTISELEGLARTLVLNTLEADQFDAILSNARVMIGNDSGPKHLASARGVPTVSLHIGRLNWNEWGQDGSGTILSKQVPCTGCGLNDVALCGRDAICLRAIDVDTAFEATRAYL